MLLFCVGLAAQSVMDISGETHETVLHADAGDTYAHGHHDHHSPDEDHAGDSGPLHVLLHQPCGGHCVFIAAGQVPSPLVDYVPVGLPTELTPRISRSDYQAPFRPPIRV
jgi:hypothetical protein